MDVINQLENGKRVELQAPCDCGEQVRHDDGGNYHEMVVVECDGANYYALHTTTSRLMPQQEWNEISKAEAHGIIQQRVADGWICETL